MAGRAADLWLSDAPSSASSRLSRNEERSWWLSWLIGKRHRIRVKIRRFQAVGVGVVVAIAVLASSAPAYATQITGQAVPASATLGDSVYDTAALGGGIPPTSGDVTFRLYDDGACANEVFMSVNSLSGPMGRDATSGSFVPTAVGTYHWTAAWAGDANNPAAGPTPCLDPSQQLEILPPAPVILPAAAADLTSPETVIASKKRNGATAKFIFTSSELGSTFECKLDKRAFKPCESPKRYKKLSDGKHTFLVRASDATANLDASPAKVKFKI